MSVPELVRWFTTHYPTARERLACARRAYGRWARSAAPNSPVALTMRPDWSDYPVRMRSIAVTELKAHGLARLAWGGCLMSIGCGGTTTASVPGGEAGTDSATTSSGGEAGTDSGVAPSSGGADASSPINPIGIGSIIGAMTLDSGAAAFADAGSTAMPSTPEVADGCNLLCAKEVSAACSAGGTLASCVTGCRVILANPSCASAAQGWFSCAQTATASCDGSGNVVFDACQIEELGVDACFLQNANDPGLAGPCATYCAAVAAAGCPNDTSGCQTGCQILGNLAPGCDMAWQNYVTCAKGSTLTCGADGKAGAPACGIQALTFFACTAGGVATILSDGGQ